MQTQDMDGENKNKHKNKKTIEHIHHFTRNTVGTFILKCFCAHMNISLRLSSVNSRKKNWTRRQSRLLNLHVGMNEKDEYENIRFSETLIYSQLFSYVWIPHWNGDKNKSQY